VVLPAHGGASSLSVLLRNPDQHHQVVQPVFRPSTQPAHLPVDELRANVTSVRRRRYFVSICMSPPLPVHTFVALRSLNGKSRWGKAPGSTFIVQLENDRFATRGRLRNARSARRWRPAVTLWNRLNERRLPPCIPVRSIRHRRRFALGASSGAESLSPFAHSKPS
jgi:hypothetical protein